ncbi:hypothetical protein CFP56_030094 [Quercus suber]|uniref:Uncharacterized protein n=1 Tax=Quercus suber TaxID=58331 RepID=A0AAW0JQX8_QUESU
MPELLPFQKNSTLASRVLCWLQNVEPRTTPLPVVIMQECLTHFLTVIFNKLDKGETWDDDFELNTLLQESIRNSADGMLLSPDSLVVYIAKNQGFDGDQQPSLATVASPPRKNRVHSFGIDGLDLLKFTYKVYYVWFHFVLSFNSIS